MIHEIRTYDIKVGMVAGYQEKFAEKLPRRSKLSPLGGHWYTEAGPLNQLTAVWPYESIEERAKIRAEAEADPSVWPPDTSSFVTRMTSRIYQPAPFMTPLGERKIGPLYEMRMYTYSPEDIPRVLEAWGERMSRREELSPLAGCWYTEAGGRDNFIHMWAYSSFDERVRIRQEAREKGIWPPPSGVSPVQQETKILWPAPFSPMQ